MKRPHKTRWWADARRLFSWGNEMRDVAEILRVSLGTLYRWRREDCKRGLHWQALRAGERKVNAAVVVATLERRFLELAVREDLTATAQADALHKLSLALQAERAYLTEEEAGRGGA